MSRKAQRKKKPEPAARPAAALILLAGLSLWAIRKKREIALPLVWLAVWLLPVLNLWARGP